MEDDRRIGVNSPIITRSESKAKRGTVGLEEKSELYHKKVKVRDLGHPGVKVGGCGLGLNAEDVSSSVNVKSRVNNVECVSETKRKSERMKKNERMKKKIELAKKEQADRFAKIAAPTGLLTGLNPGIINHVRNTKQVHSIIEALVKSEKYDNFPVGGNQTNKEIGTEGEPNALSAGRHIVGYSALPDESAMGGKSGFERTNHPSNSNTDNNDACANLTDVTALSINAAKVASQWLDLLIQDTKGRLAALRSSRKRVQEVVQTEFPYLILRELSHNPQDSGGTVNAHHARWSALFYQLDENLSEEECQLVSWLKQVQEMQLQCEWGLTKFNAVPYGSPQLAALQNDNRLERDAERDLAVRAAAASIYSTCNFLSSMENQNLL